jgi:hypothetical protein
VAGPSVAVRIIADLTGFAKSLTDTGKKGEDSAKKLHEAFSGAIGALNKTGVLGPFGDALDGIDQALDGVAKHGKDLGLAFIGVGGAVAGIGAGLSTLGSKDKASHQQLQQAVQATGKDYEDYASQVEGTIKHQENFGHSAADTQDALRVMTTALGDPQKALNNLGTVADLAAARHESLSQAADELARASTGSSRIMREYGIQTKDTSGHLKSQDQLMGELSGRLKGQASAAADTFSGHLNAVKTKLEDTAATIGVKYGPAITAAGSLMAGFGATATVAQSAVKALHDSQLLQAAATKIVTAAQWLWNAAMDANPIVLIVLAIIALIAIIFLLVTKTHILQDVWKEMQKIAGEVWDGIKKAVVTVFDWIKEHWPLLLAILTGPYGLAVLEIARHWQAIKDGVADVIRWIKGAWDDMVSWFSGIPGRLGHIFGGMWDGIYHAFVGALNKVIDAWNSLSFTTPHVKVFGKEIGGETIGVPHIPHLAQGGLITQTGLVFAHAGEAITPAPGRTGPAVHIDNVNLAGGADVDLLLHRINFAVSAGRL